VRADRFNKKTPLVSNRAGVLVCKVLQESSRLLVRPRTGDAARLHERPSLFDGYQPVEDCASAVLHAKPFSRNYARGSGLLMAVRPPTVSSMRVRLPMETRYEVLDVRLRSLVFARVLYLDHFEQADRRFFNTLRCVRPTERVTRS